jgi:hypothetical protein
VIATDAIDATPSAPTTRLSEPKDVPANYIGISSLLPNSITKVVGEKPCLKGGKELPAHNAGQYIASNSLPNIGRHLLKSAPYPYDGQITSGETLGVTKRDLGDVNPKNNMLVSNNL